VPAEIDNKLWPGAAEAGWRVLEAYKNSWQIKGWAYVDAKGAYFRTLKAALAAAGQQDDADMGVFEGGGGSGRGGAGRAGARRGGRGGGRGGGGRAGSGRSAARGGLGGSGRIYNPAHELIKGFVYPDVKLIMSRGGTSMSEPPQKRRKS
jgi:hypothetical protein